VLPALSLRHESSSSSSSSSKGKTSWVQLPPKPLSIASMCWAAARRQVDRCTVL
jgi:hypothetical protein